MTENGHLSLHDAGTDGDSSANKQASSDQNLTTARARKQKELDAEYWALMAHYAPSLTEREAIAPRGQSLPAAGTIYFVGPEGGPIKIGFASRLEFRLRELRTMNAFPLMVHATLEGHPSLKRDYHRKFAAHRLHGEWFAPHPDILAEIDRLNALALFK